MKIHLSPFSKRDSFTSALIAAAILTFLLVMAGYLVRFDGVSNACPDWPTCYGQAGMSVSTAAQLEIAHRILAAITALATLTIAVWAYACKSTLQSVKVLLATAAAAILLESLAGGWFVKQVSSAVADNIHLGLAVITLGLVTGAAVSGSLATNVEIKLDRDRRRFNRLAWLTLTAVFLVMLSGAWVSSTASATACSGWPLCSGGLPVTFAGWLAFGHRYLALVAGGLTALMFSTAWKRHFRQPVLLVSATGSALLFVGQVLISALKVSRGYPLELVALHAAATAALWAVLIVTVTAAGLEPTVLPDATVPEQRPDGAKRWKAFLMLNKPIIVALLLVTTFAGMVVGAKQLPNFWLVFWTMIGGALSAGGASALNQVIDREIDGRMQRTAKRPLPAGALTPAEGLAYGLGACLAAFFIMAGFVNLLAAVLSLAGMIYYVLLYSIWLKHATVQNIVIGGGAGAIPPLVGWAAATGSLNIPSLFLFAIVFMWTPPHFWALAIVRKNDYARAGVPMLPVVEGEHKARVQIFIYTLELVAMTLLMPLFKVGGSVYLISAAVLGAWLIYAAWNVLKKPGNKVAWMMYRYSSMYLAFIFLALVVDALI